MYKYILSIILVSSLLTGVSITPEITSNLTALEQLQFQQQKSLQLIAQETEEDITAGDERDNREED